MGRVLLTGGRAPFSVLLLGGGGWRGILREIRLGKVRGCLSVQVVEEAAKMYKSLPASCSPSSQDDGLNRRSCREDKLANGGP